MARGLYSALGFWPDQDLSEMTALGATRVSWFTMD
jgi:hypothetical protein